LIPIEFGYGDVDDFFYGNEYGITKLVPAPAPLPSLLVISKLRTLPTNAFVYKSAE